MLKLQLQKELNPGMKETLLFLIFENNIWLNMIGCWTI